jgi:exodeoxyribonuclease VII large subunit
MDLFDLPFEEHERWGPDEGLLPAPPARGERRVMTVSELTAAIRRQLETGFSDLWVEGELSNCKLWNSGHLYFTLKDDRSQIKAMMYRSAVRYLRFKPEDGLHVIARGRLGVYEPKGEYQLACEHIEPRGLGALQLAFEQLKKRLQAEGLFDAARKRPIPALPRRIGLVTSLDGAAIRDVLKVLRRRAPNARVLIRPARVQGDGAADDVARGVAALARVGDVDVIIVARGGGSAEDLWAFNEERVARAIVASRVPIISAIGHEVDFTIADFVADLRAPTPSAAAEMVVAATDEFCTRIDRLHDRLHAAVRAALQRRRNAVHMLASRRGLAAFHARTAMRGRHLGELTHALRRAGTANTESRARRLRLLTHRLEQRDPARRLAAARARLDAATLRLSSSVERRRHVADAALRTVAGRLESLSPLAVLGRGYAVCWTADRSAIVRDAGAVAPGDRVRVTLHRGEIACRVEEDRPLRRSSDPSRTDQR